MFFLLDTTGLVGDFSQIACPFHSGTLRGGTQKRFSTAEDGPTTGWRHAFSFNLHPCQAHMDGYMLFF